MPVSSNSFNGRISGNIYRPDAECAKYAALVLPALALPVNYIGNNSYDKSS